MMPEGSLSRKALPWAGGYRLLAVGFLVAIPTVSMANAAMGLALEMFDYRFWAVYVIAMVLVEAVMIGRSIGVGWFKSILIAVGANAFTAFMCPSCIAPVLHFDGADANPLMIAVWMFALFGVVSALIESAIWAVAIRRQFPWASTTWRSLKAHAVGVPVALGILLIPSRPYIGLEATTAFWRGFRLQHLLTYEFQNDVRAKNYFPEVQSVEDLVDRYNGPDHYYSWTIAYLPDFARFDTGERKRYPLEWNSRLSGANLDEINHMHKDMWLVRGKSRSGRLTGYLWMANSSGIKWSDDPIRLGYQAS